jgi:hypothetical protein
MSANYRRIDFRQNPRIQEKLPIRWKIQGSDHAGVGRIRNISASGMQIETRAAQNPPENATLAFETSTRSGKNFVPQIGRLIWAQKAGLRNTCRWGVEFVNPPEDILLRLRERVHAKVVQLVRRDNIQNLIGVALFAVAIVMAAFVLREQQANYHSLEKSSQLILAASDSQAKVSRQYALLYRQSQGALAELTTELATIRTALTEAETFLSRIQNENFLIENQLAALQMNMEFGNELAALQAENTRMEAELVSLQEQMRVFEGRINTVEEGRTLEAFYKDKIRGIQSRIRDLRLAADRERDQALLLVGNQGVLSNGYYTPADGLPGGPSPKRAININVSFF